MFALGVALMGCGGEEADTSAAVDSGWSGLACEDIYTWSTVGAPVLYTWCTPCHSSQLVGDERQGAPDGVDLETLEHARTWADRIEARALGEAPSMPPVGGPTEQELTELQAWIDCGLPE